MRPERKKFFTAVSILVGTSIGAGVLGIPYVAAQAGFLVSLFYIFLIGGLILVVNLYLGEVSLRTKGKHQIIGYAEKYLGKNGKQLMAFAMIFGVYAATVAYLVGVGESLSFLVLGDFSYSVLFGIFFGIVMSGLLWAGASSLKRYEKLGVLGILFILILIFVFFIGDIKAHNLSGFHKANFFLPFGVILFSLMSFHAIPEINIVFKNNKKLMKKTIFTSLIITLLFYILFAFIVVGFNGTNTPEIATLSLGKVFVVLGIFTMFTSYLSLGTSLEDGFIFDEHFRRRHAWALSSIIPIFIFLGIKFLDIFSFTKILSIGGVVSGGITAILILFMARKAKNNGDRKPEYSFSINWFVIILLSLFFVFGIVYGLFF